MRSGCLDLWAFGPSMMIWPEGLWRLKFTKKEVPHITEKVLTLEQAGPAK